MGITEVVTVSRLPIKPLEAMITYAKFGPAERRRMTTKQGIVHVRVTRVIIPPCPGLHRKVGEVDYFLVWEPLKELRTAICRRHKLASSVCFRLQLLLCTLPGATRFCVTSWFYGAAVGLSCAVVILGCRF